MSKKSPKRQPEPATEPTPAPTNSKPPPLNVKKQRLPPDAEARARQSRKDSAEIEYLVWQSIYS